MYEFVVLDHLLQRQDGDGRSFPSLGTLSQAIMSTRQVQRATGALAQRGLISIDRRRLKGGGIRLTYTVNIDVLLDIIHTNDSLLDRQSSGQTVVVQTTDSPLVHMTDSRLNQTPIEPDSVNQTQDMAAAIAQELERQKAESFDDYRERIDHEPRYAGLDLEFEHRKFLEYWSEGPRKLKAPKRAWRNWLEIAVERRDGKQKGYGKKKNNVGADAGAGNQAPVEGW